MKGDGQGFFLAGGQWNGVGKDLRKVGKITETTYLMGSSGMKSRKKKHVAGIDSFKV